jgi:hypothetical protein
MPVAVEIADVAAFAYAVAITYAVAIAYTVAIAHCQELALQRAAFGRRSSALNAHYQKR